MQIDWWTLALQAVNFLVLVWLLQRFLYKPVMRVIQRRQEEAQKAFSEASAAEADAEETRREYESRAAGLADERQRMMEETRAELEEERQDVLRQARRDAADITAATRARLAEEREAALAELRARIVDLAGDIAGELLRQAGPKVVTESFLERIESYMRGLPEADLHGLRDQLADGEALHVVTATELDRATAARWRKRLRGHLGDDVPVEFMTDGGLIAGAELRFPHAVLRFNWREALAAAREELKKDVVPH